MTDKLLGAQERAEILLEALPYIRRFQNTPSSSSTAATPWWTTRLKKSLPSTLS